MASAFAVPFRLTAPPGAATGVGSHNDTNVAVGPDDEGFGLTIFPVTEGVLDPCDRHGAAVSMGPGVEGVLAYLGSLADHGVTTTPAEDVTIAGEPRRSVTFTVDPSCGDAAYLFEQGGYAMGGSSGTRVTLFEPRPGTILAVLASPEALAEDDWLQSVLASIEFLD